MHFSSQNVERKKLEINLIILQEIILIVALRRSPPWAQHKCVRVRAPAGDPDYKIVLEAYPYVTRRLTTDDSPMLR
jgi:hypothetical protein